MLPLRYLIKEGLTGLRRTPVASVVTILTIVTALVLVGVFWYVSLNLESLVSTMRSQVELEAFLLPQQTTSVDVIRTQVLNVPGVDSVHFISQQEAARLFEQQTGERVTTLLDTNPFPASLRIALRPGYSSGSNVLSVAGTIETISGVDTVMYRQELVNRIDSVAETTRQVGLIGGGIILLIALVLTSNTIRLAIYAKRNLVRTLQLVGATRMFIRIPFILEGMVHGLLGALIASGILAACVVGAKQFLPAANVLTPPMIFYAGLAVGGVALGFLGSLVSVLKFISGR